MRVLPGTYGVFTLRKELHVVGAGANQVLVDGPGTGVEVSGIQGEAVISGMTVHGNGSLFGSLVPAVHVHANPGRVILHDLVLGVQDSLYLRTASLLASDTQHLLVDACTILGAETTRHQLAWSFQARNAIEVSRCSLVVVGSTLRGGDSGYNPTVGTPHVATPGGHALVLTDSTAHVATSSIFGGSGGRTYDPWLGWFGTDAGDALFATRSSVKLVGPTESLLQGGAPVGSPGRIGNGLRLESSSQAIVSSTLVITSVAGSSHGVFVDGSSSVSFTSRAFPILSSSASAVGLGGTLTFLSSPQPGPQVLFAGVSTDTPRTHLGVDGTWFLDLAAMIHLPSSTIAVPPDVNLLGVVLVTQAFAIDGSSVVVSNPLSVTVR